MVVIAVDDLVAGFGQLTKVAFVLLLAKVERPFVAGSVACAGFSLVASRLAVVDVSFVVASSVALGAVLESFALLLFGQLFVVHLFGLDIG